VYGSPIGVATETEASSPEPEPEPEPIALAAPADEFFSFVTNIATAVAAQIEPWKVRVGETVAYWAGEGYRTAALERLMSEPVAPPNYEAVLRGYGHAVEQLRQLESRITTVDPSLGGDELFRDPERLAYHRPGLPAQVLYKVRFRQREVWPTYRGFDGDHIEVDIYEHWLEPAS